MTTFPAPRERSYSASNPPYLLTERYGFEVGDKSFALQFQPVTHRDGYDPRQLAALRKTATCEVSFRLENCVLPDGTLLSGYDTLGTGNPFKVLGGVANGIVEWAEKHRPT